MLKSTRGFTLMEIMIVLAILGAIFALIGGRVTGALDKSKAKEAKIQLGQIQNALNFYYTDCGKYPPTLDGLAKDSGDCKNWGPDPYYNKKREDPWGNPLSYELDGGEYILKSFGKDGKEGGSGYNSDINLDE